MPSRPRNSRSFLLWMFAPLLACRIDVSDFGVLMLPRQCMSPIVGGDADRGANDGARLVSVPRSECSACVAQYPQVTRVEQTMHSSQLRTRVLPPARAPESDPPETLHLSVPPSDALS